jgi:DNA-binding CsgD family transcriptional regulator
MKLDNPYSAATAEGAATVLPLPDLPGCSSFRRTGMGGEPANANATAIFEEAALSHNPGVGLDEPSGPQCPRACRVCFLAKEYGLTPRNVNVIALICSGQSSRAMSRTLGIKVETIREYCRIIHRKIGTHSRLAIGLWAIRKGMVKGAIPPGSRFPNTDPYQGGPAD